MQSVNELCEKGNSLSEVGMYQEALSCFKHALEKTPETYDYEDERDFLWRQPLRLLWKRPIYAKKNNRRKLRMKQ